MAFSELYVCDLCSNDIVLVHADLWTPGPDGTPLPYAERNMVGGLLNRLWCGQCRAVRRFPFVTLDPPGDHPVIAYAEAQRLNCTGSETGPCPVCSTPLTWAVDGVPCAACSGGVYRFTGEWEDAV